MSKITKKSQILALYQSGATKPADILAALQAQGVSTTLNSINVVLSKARKGATEVAEDSSPEETSTETSSTEE